MTLQTLKPRLQSLNINRAPTLQVKAGSTVMPSGRGWMATRDRVALAHGYRCAKCGSVWVAARDHIDHIIPREQGGSNEDFNLQPLCDAPCHADKTAAEAKVRAGRSSRP